MILFVHFISNVGHSFDIMVLTQIHIMDLLEQNHSQQYIASYIKCCQSTVSRMINHFMIDLMIGFNDRFLQTVIGIEANS